MKSWTPVFCLSFAAFTFVTSEFIPVGLLSTISASFSQSEAQTGLMMTLYAWIVALLSLPFTAYASRFDRRPLLLALIVIFFLAHMLSAVAWSFAALVSSRIFVAAAHAIFWAVAPPLGARLAPGGKRERGLAIVATGATLGGVLGIPFATYLGQLFGWRMAFGAIGALAGLLGLALYALLPSSMSQNRSNLAVVKSIFKRPALVLIYLTTLITMTGHYAAFTFIGPYLEKVGGIPQTQIAPVLLLYGLSGLLASFAAPKYLAANIRGCSYAATAVMAACLFSFWFAASYYFTALLVMVIWAAASLFINLILQNLVLNLAPDAEDVATAGYSGIYNIGIGGGALIGSLASGAHLGSLGFMSAGFLLMALVLLVIFFRMQPSQTQVKISAGH